MEPEDLTPYTVQTFEQVKKRLPPEISSRLKSSRSVKRHRSARTVYLFNIWDRNQTDLFQRDHFTYCLGYDPIHRYGPSTWYLHLWINTVRIYQYSDVIRQALVEILQRQCPVGFTPHVNDRAVQAVLRADFAGPLTAFQNYFLPRYEALIGTLHPFLMPIIDSFIYDLSREEREEVIASRKRFYCGPTRRMSAEQIREYSRSIPPSWRRLLLDQHGHRCVHCTGVLDLETVHIDHKKPFSKGGTTTLENLQPLCVPCNLKKGNRYSG